MEKILHTISNIFKVSNTGTIFFFLLNLWMLLGIVNFMTGGETSGYVTVLILYVISLVCSFSPVGQALLCFLNGAKKMSRLDMREKTLPIVQEVFLAAKRKTPTLPDKINVRIMYDPNPNAFAIGTNTICITEGMLDMPDNLIAGVIAHEMGHLAMQHTVIQILIGGGNLIMTGMMLILELLKNLCSAGSSSRRSRKRDSFDGAGMLIGVFSAGMIYMWTKFCMLILTGSSRANEYAADTYAYEIGYGEDLAEALDRLTMGIPQSTFLQLLTSSHPEPGDRIGRLQSMGVFYSRY